MYEWSDPDDDRARVLTGIDMRREAAHEFEAAHPDAAVAMVQVAQGDEGKEGRAIYLSHHQAAELIFELLDGMGILSDTAVSRVRGAQHPYDALTAIMAEVEPWPV